MTTRLSSTHSLSIEALQANFIEMLPQLNTHAEAAFGDIRCEHQRADHVADALGLAWKQFLALARRDEAAHACLTDLAQRCCQAVRTGRSVHRRRNTHDVLAPLAQQRHGFLVERLRA